MSDTIKPEERFAVEESPAPPHPRPDSAAVSREPAGGSPCEAPRDDIDALVDLALQRGPQRSRKFDRCRFCGQEWHGKTNTEGCEGSHLDIHTRKEREHAEGNRECREERDQAGEAADQEEADNPQELAAPVPANTILRWDKLGDNTYG